MLMLKKIITSLLCLVLFLFARGECDTITFILCSFCDDITIPFHMAYNESKSLQHYHLKAGDCIKIPRFNVDAKEVKVQIFSTHYRLAPQNTYMVTWMHDKLILYKTKLPDKGSYHVSFQSSFHLNGLEMIDNYPIPVSPVDTITYLPPHHVQFNKLEITMCSLKYCFSSYHDDFVALIYYPYAALTIPYCYILDKGICVYTKRRSDIKAKGYKEPILSASSFNWKSFTIPSHQITSEFEIGERNSNWVIVDITQKNYSISPVQFTSDDPSIKVNGREDNDSIIYFPPLHPEEKNKKIYNIVWELQSGKKISKKVELIPTDFSGRTIFFKAHAAAKWENDHLASLNTNNYRYYTPSGKRKVQIYTSEVDDDFNNGSEDTDDEEEEEIWRSTSAHKVKYTPILTLNKRPKKSAEYSSINTKEDLDERTPKFFSDEALSFKDALKEENSENKNKKVLPGTNLIDTLEIFVPNDTVIVKNDVEAVFNDSSVFFFAWHECPHFPSRMIGVHRIWFDKNEFHFENPKVKYNETIGIVPSNPIVEPRSFPARSKSTFVQYDKRSNSSESFVLFKGTSGDFEPSDGQALFENPKTGNKLRQKISNYRREKADRNLSGKNFGHQSQADVSQSENSQRLSTFGKNIEATNEYKTPDRQAAEIIANDRKKLVRRNQNRRVQTLRNKDTSYRIIVDEATPKGSLNGKGKSQTLRYFDMNNVMHVMKRENIESGKCYHATGNVNTTESPSSLCSLLSPSNTAEHMNFSPQSAAKKTRKSENKLKIGIKEKNDLSLSSILDRSLVVQAQLDNSDIFTPSLQAIFPQDNPSAQRAAQRNKGNTSFLPSPLLGSHMNLHISSERTKSPESGLFMLSQDQGTNNEGNSKTSGSDSKGSSKDSVVIVRQEKTTYKNKCNSFMLESNGGRSIEQYGTDTTYRKNSDSVHQIHPSRMDDVNQRAKGIRYPSSATLTRKLFLEEKIEEQEDKRIKRISPQKDLLVIDLVANEQTLEPHDLEERPSNNAPEPSSNQETPDTDTSITVVHCLVNLCNVKCLVIVPGLLLLAAVVLAFIQLFKDSDSSAIPPE